MKVLFKEQSEKDTLYKLMNMKLNIRIDREFAEKWKMIERDKREGILDG